jgi:5-methylcytosine-specific restriction endonuclease McrA
VGGVAKGWSGRRVTLERARLAALLPLACSRCGRPVTSEMVWHVDHLLERVLGGGNGRANLGVAHARCNMSAGQALGQRRRQARARVRAGIKPW